MSKFTVVALALAGSALAQTKLTDKRFDYANLPLKADTDTGDRGPQFGVNQCTEATTGGQNSTCQTGMINSIDDFCLWGAPVVNSVVGNTEGESVAWCTKPGRGTRVIPPGAITGVQFIQTPGYVQVTGFIDQAQVDIQHDDGGGEMDPHGADERGNPLGGLIFSNAFPSNGGAKDKYQQVIEWHNFMGGNEFCFKACDPTGPNAAKLCEHVYDRIGCRYNAPAAYVDGVFESCKGDDQDFPGHYKDASGADQVYQQPPESLGPIATIPYVARIPASSQCVQYKSADLYAAAATVKPNPTLSSSGSVTSATRSPTKAPTGASKSSTGAPTGTTNAAAMGAIPNVVLTGFAGLLAGAIALVARL
jgi:hypothetical protein